jgi:hypothetical protein
MNSENESTGTIGPYRLYGPLDPAGRGSACVAVKANEPPAPPARPVALRKGPSDPARRLAWLERARTTMGLQHPNLTPRLEVGSEGAGFVASEYLIGEDLGRILAQRGGGGIPPEIAVNLVQQCLAGLQVCHDAGPGRRPLIHGAIRPSNIVLTYDGVAKLTDPGTASDGGAAREGQAGLYLAPEQLTGATPDARSDLFCVGIVLWEALTGRCLFDGGGGREAQEAINNRPIPSPSSLRPEVPPELDAAVARALARERSLRYPNAAEMKWGLEAAARRLTRPTPAGIGLWLRGLFGAERASLRRAIALGTDVEACLQRLAQLVRESEGLVEGARPLLRSRPLWGPGRSVTGVSAAVHDTPVETDTHPTPRGLPAHNTDPDLPVVEVLEDPPPPSPPAELGRAPQPGRRGWMRSLAWLGSAAALVAVLAASAGWFAPGRQSRRPASDDDLSASTGGLRIESTPAGASVTVDGNPTGLSTPAVIDGLPSGRQLQIDLHRSGYQPASREVAVRAGTVQLQSFELHESSGKLRLDGLPDRAAVYADDQALEGGPVFALPIGRRRIRVELADDVFFTGEVEVRAGEQTLNVRGKAK